MSGRVRFYLSKVRAGLEVWEAERRLLSRYPGLRLGRGVAVVSPDRLRVGEHVLVQQGTILHCGGLPWSDGRGHIQIGADSVISHYCVLFGAGEIDIGPRFDCGPGCMIFSSRTVYGGGLMLGAHSGGHLFAKVVIGEGVILYAGCIVAPGVTIGDGAAVGAGSVVLGDVPPRMLYAGVPAVPVRDISATRMADGPS